MSPEQVAFISKCSISARMVGTNFPDMVGCEAALESAFGQSELARDYNNLFGMKAKQHPDFGTVNLPTREFQDGQWITISAKWENYPTLEDCFADRLATLTRLKSVYPHYAAALAADNAETYVQEVSKTWSTDPNRAFKCISIYRDYTDTITAPPPLIPKAP